MTDIELMIGQSSTEAERKRAARLENKALLPPRTKGGHLSDIRPPEIEIELEKEIEIEKEREGETGHPAAYGRYNNVILTDTELSGLKTELPDKWEYYICLLYTSAAQEQKLEELTLKIEDVETLLDDVSDAAYDKAVEVVTCLLYTSI